MKIKITASSSYDEYVSINHGRQRFGVHIDSYDEGDDSSLFLMPRFQMSEIHPYDDADYMWAKRSDNESNQILYIKNGKIVDKMTIWDYEPEDYEDPTEYVNEVLDTVAVNLMSQNADVEPRMIHN